jgi:hypothetical protein
LLRAAPAVVRPPNTVLSTAEVTVEAKLRVAENYEVVRYHEQGRMYSSRTYTKSCSKLRGRESNGRRSRGCVESSAYQRRLIPHRSYGKIEFDSGLVVDGRISETGEFALHDAEERRGRSGAVLLGFAARSTLASFPLPLIITALLPTNYDL